VERVRLPEAARRRVLALADDQLGATPAHELPPTLRPFRAFTPAKRARAAAPALATALESDAAFRAAVAGRVREAFPELAAEVAEGRAPAAADPVLVAVMAYLLRPDGWHELVAEAGSSLAGAADAGGVAEARERADALARELEQARSAAAKADRERRAELETLRREIKTLQQRVKAAEEETRRADARTRAVEQSVESAVAESSRATTEAQRRERRLQGQVSQLEADLEAARRGVREARATDDVRLRVLLDTVVEAAAGLRRELALPPSGGRPADAVAGDAGAGRGTAARGLSHSDPAYLEALLAAPQVHLIVDGYNVTKTAYPAATLEDQRSRLVQGLGALAARTRAEITVVFDGAEMVGHVAPPRARGVRVRFSPPGQIADELIAAFVRAEPQGRPLVVASSDREVADHASARGATAVSSAALAALLERA
jgi:predicted RNA-binding protein with PIN domain